MNSVVINLDIQIEGTAQQVFAGITRSPALWWGIKYIENKDEATDLVFEPKVGGRFYERWGRTPGDREGVLIGTVIAIKEPELVILQGPFGMAGKAAMNTVTFSLHKHARRTHLKLTHEASGNLSEGMEQQYRQGWQDLLERLKVFIERHTGSGIRQDPYVGHIEEGP